ncbi:GDSL-like lipase acylhydrolase [Colletotrichum kahawae]|uniref:GDSL-like lipase acylhydrolase n=1 Tax=Colletotrichum kahawae TaxID=34407 RepID=A0AAD9Y5I9_COLKA|nr:GDSL-like lipase acylhydrolase [Colletotrichum kahawae]
MATNVLSNSAANAIFNVIIDDFSDDDLYSTSQKVVRQAAPANYWTFDTSGLNLRILPLGNSITNDFQSSFGNGYRLQLLNNLKGNTVDFVGSVQAGTMSDSDNEGHNGATIDQISSFATVSLPQRPNVVLLHAGTNDINGNIDTAKCSCPRLETSMGARIPDSLLSHQAIENLRKKQWVGGLPPLFYKGAIRLLLPCGRSGCSTSLLHTTPPAPTVSAALGLSP